MTDHMALLPEYDASQSGRAFQQLGGRIRICFVSLAMDIKV